MRRAEAKARKEAEIARAAAELFVTQGVAHTTVEQIAERARVSERTFFRYFPTKEDAVLSYIWLRVDDLRAAFLARPPEESLSDAFLAAVRTGTPTDERERDLDHALLRLLRQTPALRARWLVAGWETAELFTPLIAGRLGTDPSSLEARVAAGALLVAAQTALDIVAEQNLDFLAALERSLVIVAAGAGLGARRP
jgi:AcrR family transcriptional regulator